MDLVAAVVRALRNSRGHTQREVAESVGVSLSTYKRLERGTYLVSGYDLQRLGRHFRIDANLLVFGFTLISDPGIGADLDVQRWQRIVYQLRALPVSAQNAILSLVSDLYTLNRRDGGPSARRAALDAERRLVDALQKRTG